MNYSNQKELVEFLKVIDKQVEKEGAQRKLDLFLFGGGAAVISYGMNRATIDLDILLDEQALEQKLVQWGGKDTNIHKKYGLYLQKAPLMMMPIEDPDWKERCHEILKGTCKFLRVLAVSKEDLILSKLGRYESKDQSDIKHLIEAGKADLKKLIRYYKSARSFYAGNLRRLDTTFNIVLKEHYGTGPIKFK